ncbi:hypothetical protein ACP70R_005696 [Stipagrostis hirtigluma subsp. patula]
MLQTSMLGVLCSGKAYSTRGGRRSELYIAATSELAPLITGDDSISTAYFMEPALMLIFSTGAGGSFIKPRLRV